ncbi:MAG: hypothetical protein LBT66_01420 [Methanobrevibacter sp.]|jgi:hypothetical protein|nr:hypothetical protein [Candidatus Methanovirga meridionalis]
MVKIERKISFYKIIFKKNDIDVKPMEIFNFINDLPFNDSGKYFPMINGNSRSMFVESVDSDIIKCFIGNRRNTNLPLIEENGTTSPLKIEPKQSLFEPMHFIIFPDNVLASEFNSYGPRVKSLEEYLLNKANNLVDDIKILPLMNEDISKTIAEMGAIKKFNIAVHKNKLQDIKYLDQNMFDGIKKLSETSDSDIIEILIRPKKYQKKPISILFLDKIADFLTIHKDSVDTCKLVAENSNNDYKVEKFNLLENFIFSKKTVETIDDQQRHVKSDSIFEAIIKSYEECKNKINEIINGK